MGLGVAGSVALGAAAIGAGGSIIASQNAAGAAGKAAAGAQAQQTQTRLDLLPFTENGINASTVLAQRSGENWGLNTNYLQMAQDAMPGQMTQAQLEKTPGYQFQLNQGLQATQNAAAAKGLGVSGAALKGAATFATGLADSNYQNQFNNAQTRSQDFLNLNTGAQGNAMNEYNRMMGQATLGENAAAQTGAQGTQAANNAGGFLSAQGNAQAAGALGVGSAASGAANNFLFSNALNNLAGGGAANFDSGSPAQPF
jgi:hypothetical protein